MWQPEKIRKSSEVKKLRSLKPDLIITAAFGQILPKEILDTPRHGCINVHASLLPKYRGGAPIHRAIIAGERETGVTLMYMAEELDAGDILTQHTVPIGESDTAGTMHDKLSEAGAELLRTSLPAILDGKITPKQQDERLATYAPNIQRADERIDWTQSATAIFNQIRGLNPWPVAFTTLSNKPFKIWEARVADSRDVSKTPGTITRHDDTEMFVATGRGTLQLLRVQPAGKKPMSVPQFLRGNAIKNGTRLGETDE